MFFSLLYYFTKLGPIQVMILVLTFRGYEQSTDPVVDWLLYHKAPFVKIFMEDLMTQTHRYRIDVDDKKIYVDGTEVSEEINVVFFRRFGKTVHFKPEINLGQINAKVDREGNGELEDLFNYLFYVLDDKTWFPHYSKVEVNKLEMLNKAKEAGLKTPVSIVTNSKSELLRFKSKTGRVVCKPIRQISYYVFGKYTYSPYTTEMDDDKIEELPDFFFPSLFQGRVDSEYEIRCFYLDGKIYASAIMANAEEKDVDIKLSFNAKSTKWVNYRLPDEIREKILFFMNSVGLNTGSMDVLKSVDGQYYFIEVNPVGQYFAPSVNCNLHIEKKIAEWLINKDLL